MRNLLFIFLIAAPCHADIFRGERAAGSSGSSMFAQAYVGPGFFGTSANGLNVSSQPACEIFTVYSQVSVDSGTVFVNTGSGMVDIGIYDNSGNRLVSTGATSIQGLAGRVNIPFSASQSLSPGTYWECLVANNTVAQFSTATVTTTAPVGQQTCSQSAGNFPLPTTLSFPCSVVRPVAYDLWIHPVGSGA